jgi:hypothetical protein
VIKNGLSHGARVVLTDAITNQDGELPPGTEARFVEPLELYATEGREDFFDVEYKGQQITVQRWQIRDASNG